MAEEIRDEQRTKDIISKNIAVKARQIIEDRLELGQHIEEGYYCVALARNITLRQLVDNALSEYIKNNIQNEVRKNVGGD